MPRHDRPKRPRRRKLQRRPPRKRPLPGQGRVRPRCRLLAMARIVATPLEKQALGHKHQAAAVDMEESRLKI